MSGIFLPGLETSNTDLAAALCAVGIPLKKGDPVKILTGQGGDRHTFFFEERSECGRYVTDELIKAWNDPTWHERNPEHAFAYVKVAFENRRRLLDYIKSRVPIAAVKQGNKVAFLSVNASDEIQRKVFAQLKR